ncbi:Serine/threonine protein kinase PrkC, regulator of stationary phase [Labilithrix luteola]|uniref:non-specific serine/threonine protein kinase n=1 Tax=Labilithrix luteola TaxID=1391654 RepID=A0A0K1PX38_9BACT|nr:Serine/threonine protein kinase PrkC, regulator of stationary phase [Labilithrix luteola]
MIGRVIADRFKIVQLIARGGMGKVYAAEQAPLGRICAVKVLNPNYTGDADPEFHRRFFREASITSKITHPNSVTIFDYGKTDDDIYYMAMEFLEGQTLHQALREVRVMPEDRVGRIAVQICRALREAHLLEVIHRDLKPANIFLTKHGDDEDFVKVLDFGLVKQLSERPEEQLTQTGLFMGSPKYMAPEQIQGGHVDARTDVYSLGIMMYEMLTGKVPFERATSVNILMAHVGEAPPPMREVNPHLVCSPAFEELVMRCIAKDPNQRLHSMEDVLQNIRRVHGVAMTGQLSAVSLSGAYAHLSSVPPPVNSSSASGLPAGSGSHTPPGVHRPSVPAETLFEEAPRPRSRVLWVLGGVIGAAAIGGLLGMIAFHVTSPAKVTNAASAPVNTVAPAIQPGAAGASLPSVQATTPVETLPSVSSTATRDRVVTVTSDPPGASVREGNTELCASTPCQLSFKGEADGGKEHRVLVSKLGYRVELRSVGAKDDSLAVKLVRATGGAPARPVAPSKPTEAPAENGTPNGFKDLPY